MIKKPLVSVIIPTYNREKNLEIAINSVIYQTYNNYEIIVVDDNSLDNTEYLVKKIINKNLNKVKIIYIKNKTNMGNAETRNIGIKIASGLYITFLDDDDMYLPLKIEEQVNALIKSGKKHCFVGMIWIEDGKVIKTSNNSNNSKNALETGNGVFGMFHTDIFKEIGCFDKNFPANVDGDFIFRVNKKYSPAIINKDLYIHYYHNENISSNNNKKIMGWEMFVNKNKKVLNKNEMETIYFKLTIFYLFNNKKKFMYALKGIINNLKFRGIFLFLILLLPTNSLSKYILNRILNFLNYPKSFAGRYNT